MCGRKCKSCGTSLINFVNRMIISCDFFFSIPIDIRYKNQRRFTNKTTIFFSLLAYVLIIIPSMTQFYSLFFHDSPISVTSNMNDLPNYLNLSIKNDSYLPLINKDPVNYTDSLYMFGLGLFNITSGHYVKIDPSKMIILTYQRSNIKGVKYTRQINYTNCLEKFNYYDLEPSVMNEFENNILCIHENFNISGQFIDAIYNYLSIKVIRCNEFVKGKYPEFKNSNCVNQTIWQDYSRDLIVVYLDVNFYFSPNNYSNPIQSYVKKYELTFLNSLTLKMDIFMSYSILTSYDSIFPSLGNSLFSPTEYSYLSINKFNRFYSIYSPSDGEMMSIVVRTDNTILLMERYYNTLFLILAMLVGLWQAIYALISFILNRYLDFSENVEMCNKIFKIVDPNKYEQMNNNPYIINKDIHRNTSKFIQSIKNSDIEELVLYEGFKYYEFSGLEFNMIETFLHLFNYHPYTTKNKFALLDHATQHYNSFKDIKNLFNFAIHLKEFLRFNFTKNQTYIISNFLNKTKFHQKNIDNFKIIQNIVSSSSMNNEEDKRIEKKEILKNTLNKFRKRKRGELNPIDEKLLKLLRIEENLLEYFVYNEIKENDNENTLSKDKKNNIKVEKNDFIVPFSNSLNNF